MKPVSTNVTVVLQDDSLYIIFRHETLIKLYISESNIILKMDVFHWHGTGFNIRYLTCHPNRTRCDTMSITGIKIRYLTSPLTRTRCVPRSVTGFNIRYLLCPLPIRTRCVPGGITGFNIRYLPGPSKGRDVTQGLLQGVTYSIYSVPPH